MEKHYTTIACNNPSWIGMRLDKFLFSQFPDYSRSYFQELIEQGAVLVNHKQCKRNYQIKPTDEINVTFKHKEYNLNPAPIAFDIVDQTNDFIIINKPAGLMVHHAPSAPSEVSLVNGLLYYFKEMQDFDDNQRPGIVHRLDKDTSGLMIIARNRQAQAAFTTMFKNRNITKTYLALTSGNPLPAGSIDLPIGRHPIERHKMSTFGIDTKPALTHYKVLATYQKAALVAATIVTGRTHQIRVHFAALGHGLLGDKTYGVPFEQLTRQALHAWKISFEFNGKYYSYTNPLPEDLKQTISLLKTEKI